MLQAVQGNNDVPMLTDLRNPAVVTNQALSGPRGAGEGPDGKVCCGLQYGTHSDAGKEGEDDTRHCCASPGDPLLPALMPGKCSITGLLCEEHKEDDGANDEDDAYFCE